LRRTQEEECKCIPYSEVQHEYYAQCQHKWFALHTVTDLGLNIAYQNVPGDGPTVVSGSGEEVGAGKWPSGKIGARTLT